MGCSPPIWTSRPTTAKEQATVFYLDYPIAALRPAPYNPRKIDEPAFLALQHSIRTLGMVKPIIAGEDGTIVAGHQRSRAAMAVGVIEAPVYVVKELNKLDEIRFNQLHNGTDLDTGDETVRVPANNATGYFDVPWSTSRATSRPRVRASVPRSSS